MKLFSVRKLLMVGLAALLGQMAGCKVKPVEGVDFKEVNKEINARKIKKLNDTDISQAVYEEAKAALDQLKTQVIGKENLCGMKKKDFELKEVDAVSQLEIVCQLPASENPKEQQVWEAYQYNLQNKLPLEENLQRIDPEQHLFTYPLASTDSTYTIARMVLSQKEVIRKINMKEVLKNK